MRHEFMLQSIGHHLEEYPQLIPLFLQYRLNCVGCSMSSFCDIYDVLELHDLVGSNFLQEITAKVISLHTGTVSSN